jgi:hypothetical protein
VKRGHAQSEPENVIEKLLFGEMQSCRPGSFHAI